MRNKIASHSATTFNKFLLEIFSIKLSSVDNVLFYDVLQLRPDVVFSYMWRKGKVIYVGLLISLR
jgi:hypothetical protein